MEDEASTHQARYTQAVHREYQILKLEFAPCSPDLNLIETMWGLLEDRLNTRRPRITEKNEMMMAIQEEWNHITEERILAFVNTMPERIQAVIAANGGHTRW